VDVGVVVEFDGDGAVDLVAVALTIPSRCRVPVHLAVAVHDQVNDHERDGEKLRLYCIPTNSARFS
jgi:hypothetical protein